MPRKGPGAKPGSLGARLAAKMLEKGMSAADVAKIAGLSTDGVRNIATGRAPSPRAGTIQSIAAALDISTTDLIQEPADSSGTAVAKSPEEATPGWADVRQIDIFERDGASLMDMSVEGYWRIPEALLAARRIKSKDAVIIRLHADESPTYRQGDYVLVDTAQMMGPPRRGGWVIITAESFGIMFAEYRRVVDDHWGFTLHDGEGAELPIEKVKVIGLVRGKAFS